MYVCKTDIRPICFTYYKCCRCYLQKVLLDFIKTLKMKGNIASFVVYHIDVPWLFFKFKKSNTKIAMEQIGPMCYTFWKTIRMFKCYTVNSYFFFIFFAFLTEISFPSFKHCWQIGLTMPNSLSFLFLASLSRLLDV